MPTVTAVLTLLAVTVAMAPLVLDALRSGRQAWVRLAVVLALIAAGVTLASVVGTSPAPRRVPTERPVALADGLAGGRLARDYATSRACRSCHPGQHASWHASYHRTMTQVASPEAILPDLQRESFVYAGEEWVIERRGAEYWITTGAGAVRRVVQFTGSHHYQVFWYATGEGRKIALFPYCYKIAAQAWMPVDAVFLVPPDTPQDFSGGRWNANCHMCHATGVEPRPERDGRYDTRMAEFGIACESCHGPACAHVDANRSPLRRYGLHFSGDADPTIVNPARLGPQRSAQVCGQCHAVSLLRSEHAETWRDEGLPYRPGDDLHATRIIATPDSDEPQLRRLIARQPGLIASKFWSDGVIRVTGREFNGLQVSPCYTHGDPERTMTCASCHTMHQQSGDDRPAEQWAADQLGVGMDGNRACTQCHTKLEAPDALRAHTHHAPDSSGSRCYDCHMPFTSYGLQKCERSHAITSPSVAVALETGRPDACSLCHLDQPLGWTAERMSEWWGTPVPELSEDQREIAASVLWALTGDAAQRAFVTWAFEQDAARAASTNAGEWTAPFLAELMDDPYAAVRFMAGRALRRDARFADVDFDFLAPATERRRVTDAVRSRWAAGRVRSADPRLLIGPDGAMLRSIYDRLLARRDLRPVFLTE